VRLLLLLLLLFDYIAVLRRSMPPSSVVCRSVT